MQLKFVNKRGHITITGKKIPHWDQACCVQFVTFRLADSLPQSKLQEYRQTKCQWMESHPKPWDEQTQKEYDHTFTEVMDKWIDAGYGECILKDKRVRDILADVIMHYDGDQYVIHAYVIMPNHVHVLMTPADGYTIQEIVGDWKKFSSRGINKILDRRGPLWERERFDHLVRDAAGYATILSYIERNPENLPQDRYSLYTTTGRVWRKCSY